MGNLGGLVVKNPVVYTGVGQSYGSSAMRLSKLNMSIIIVRIINNNFLDLLQTIIGA